MIQRRMRHVSASSWSQGSMLPTSNIDCTPKHRTCDHQKLRNLSFQCNKDQQDCQPRNEKILFYCCWLKEFWPIFLRWLCCRQTQSLSRSALHLLSSDYLPNKYQRWISLNSLQNGFYKRNKYFLTVLLENSAATWLKHLHNDITIKDTSNNIQFR